MPSEFVLPRKAKLNRCKIWCLEPKQADFRAYHYVMSFLLDLDTVSPDMYQVNLHRFPIRAWEL